MSPSILFMLWVSDVSAGEGASVALLPRASNILPPFLSSARHTHTDKHTHKHTHTHTHIHKHMCNVSPSGRLLNWKGTLFFENQLVHLMPALALVCVYPVLLPVCPPNQMFFSRTSSSAFDDRPGVAGGAKVFRLHVSNAHLTEI